MAKNLKLSNAFSSPGRRRTPLGAPGFDNIRDSIDPHVKTQVLSTLQGVNSLPFGEVYAHEVSETVSTVLNTYVKITGFYVDGECYRCTPNVDGLEILDAGSYLVNYSFSAALPLGVANQTMEMDVFIDDVEHLSGSSRRKFGAAGDEGNQSGTAILTANIGQVINLRIKNITATKDIVVSNVSLTMVRIGR